MSIDKSKIFFEDSKSGTIGARIKVLLAKTGKAVSVIEEEGGIGNGTLKTWKDKEIDYSTTVIQNFLRTSRINEDWWKTGEGEIFIKNGTDMPKASDNKESALGELTAYKTIFEGKTEYVVIPRTVLENTRLISIDELDRKNGQIDLLIKLLGEQLTAAESLTPEKSKQKT